MLKFFRIVFTGLALGFGLVIVTSTSHADTILQPVSASTSIPVGPVGTIDNLCNQSGLSVGYTSLVDDFDSYLASNPTHDHGYGENIWGASEGIRSGDIDFDLGGTFLIESMALWNLINDSSAIGQFNLMVDDNPAFSSAVSLGSFETSNTLGVMSNTAAEVFTFNPTSAAFVRLEILNTHSDASYAVAFSEVAFSVVPEPTALTLAVSGLLGLVLCGWRRNQSR